MSTVKKWLLVYVVILAIASVALLAGSCGEEEEQYQNRAADGTSETVAATKETVAAAKVKGTIYETEMFSILVLDGWETKVLASDLSPGGGVAVVIKKGEDLIQLGVYLGPYYTDKYPDTATVEDFSKDLIENTIEQQNGTDVEEVTMFDVTFFKTSFTANGMDQTTFAGDKNGKAFSIIMGGKDHQNNAELKAMLDSIKFK